MFYYSYFVVGANTGAGPPGRVLSAGSGRARLSRRRHREWVPDGQLGIGGALVDGGAGLVQCALRCRAAWGSPGASGRPAGTRRGRPHASDRRHTGLPSGRGFPRMGGRCSDETCTGTVVLE